MTYASPLANGIFKALAGKEPPAPTPVATAISVLERATSREGFDALRKDALERLPMDEYHELLYSSQRLLEEREENGWREAEAPGPVDPIGARHESDRDQIIAEGGEPVWHIGGANGGGWLPKHPTSSTER